ncbi:hypothetical protein RhiJN_06410 [Ceratobasidium sp. AG-Ba]|nr:hypothetical protein RhiJN_06410 [Ceratobasidium sp. AG-Ba]QRW07324.1 hypothetical protein RhiLY_06323 [Ceratobasidium sp. AG-Ba]
MSPNEPPPYWPSVATNNSADSSAKFEARYSASPTASESKSDKGDGAFSLPKRPRAPSESTFRIVIPSAFKVGSKPLGPFELATIPEICAHLSLLDAFAKLKSQIKLQKGPDV